MMAAGSLAARDEEARATHCFRSVGSTVGMVCGNRMLRHVNPPDVPLQASAPGSRAHKDANMFGRRLGAALAITAAIMLDWVGARPASAQADSVELQQVEAGIGTELDTLIGKLPPICRGWINTYAPFRDRPLVALAGAYRRQPNVGGEHLRLVLGAINARLPKLQLEHFAAPDFTKELSPQETGDDVVAQHWGTLQSQNYQPQFLLFVDLIGRSASGGFRLDLVAKCRAWDSKESIKDLKLPEQPARSGDQGQRESKPLEGKEISAISAALKLPGSAASAPFKECEFCPVMRIIPGGAFEMGSPHDDDQNPSERGPDGNPLHVTIEKPFGIGVYEVTLGQFKALKPADYAVQGNCEVLTETSWKRTPDATFLRPGFVQRDNEPVVCVNWHDAVEFVKWINEKVPGKPYRLLSEAEWEYAARGGLAATQAFWWGDNPDGRKTNNKSAPWHRTVPVDDPDFDLNPFGLAHMNGNVWEWVEDCWNPNHIDNRADGTARDVEAKCYDGAANGQQMRVIRGGGWNSPMNKLRSAQRSPESQVNRYDYLGFRIGRTFSPIAK